VTFCCVSRQRSTMYNIKSNAKVYNNERGKMAARFSHDLTRRRTLGHDVAACLAPSLDGFRQGSRLIERALDTRQFPSPVSSLLCDGSSGEPRAWWRMRSKMSSRACSSSTDDSRKNEHPLGRANWCPSKNSVFDSKRVTLTLKLSKRCPVSDILRLKYSFI